MEEQLRKILVQQTAMMAELTYMTTRFLLTLWAPLLTGRANNRMWYDEDLLNGYAARSAFIMETAQRQARQRVFSYLKFVYREMEITPPNELDMVKIIRDAPYPRPNVTALEVYKRPAEQYRYAISQGKPEVEAIEAARKRIEDLGDTDLQIAKRDMFNRVMRGNRQITGYRRVVHPELSDSKMSCGLCIAASTRIYKTDELMPIHDHCNCTVMPIYDGRDPGAVFNEEDLKQLYELAGSTGAADLSRVRYGVVDHGELGPQIVPQGQKQRKVTVEERTETERINHELSILESSIQNLRLRAKGGEDLSQSIDWHRDRIELLLSRLKG